MGFIYGRTLHDLLVIFLVLKLTGLIDWSWVWVLSPAWIALSVFLFLWTYFFIHFLGEAKKDNVK